MRPASLDGDWNRLFDEFPEVYDEWSRIPHSPRLVDVIAANWTLAGAKVIDVGSGSGTSSFQLAERAAEVVGVEPNRSMRAVAERNAAAAAVSNVSFVAGTASEIPCGARRADFVTCFTTSLWPPEEIVPRFVAEAERVLRPGGSVIVVDTAPGWYGGELDEVMAGEAHHEQTLEYGRALGATFAAAGFDHFDFETVQDYGTPERAVATYGFVFGSRTIERLLARRQHVISWRWRVFHRGAAAVDLGLV